MIMDDVRTEFLEIITQARQHLELQRAFGITAVEVSSGEDRGSPPVVATAAIPATGAPDDKKIQNAYSAKSSASAGTGTLEAIRQELGDCTRCKLCSSRKTIVFGEGNPRATIVFIGDAPGREEEEQGRPFVDAAGMLLTDILVKGMQVRREDVYICTIAKCRTHDDRAPGPEALAACEPFLIRQLEAIKPKLIVALGTTVVNALLKTNEKIASLRGKWKSYQGIPLMPTFHPAYLLKNPAAKKEVWADIKKVLAEMEKLMK